MDSPRRIGPETTWNEVLIVVGRHLLRVGKVVMGGHVYNYGDATRADTGKWRAPVESPHRIGITAISSDDLTAVGGAWARYQKNAESEWSEDGFEYTTTASGYDGKWMAPVDSRLQIDVIILSCGILIVVGGSSSGG